MTLEQVQAVQLDVASLWRLHPSRRQPDALFPHEEGDGQAPRALLTQVRLMLTDSTTLIRCNMST